MPAPVAARYTRKGMHYRADLIMRRIPWVETVAERLARGALDPTLAKRVGATIAQFHSAGACHADLNAHNILVDEHGVVSLIDFDRGSLRKPALAWQQSNVARLRRSFSRYNELANGVLRGLSLDMPAIDLEHLRAIAMPQRRPVTPPPARRP